MQPSHPRRSPQDRRDSSDRRSGADRRSDNPVGLALVPVDRRGGTDRRKSDRRVVPDRRRPVSPEDHIRNALELLGQVSDGAGLEEELQRDLDSAIFRLRFALDRLEHRHP
ncbi:MAG TPA: hypothetical protein VLV45_07550 [Gemmatimonadales bacterium]|nr:hypothetical protein [Gemmatimonadales bacterium]